MPSMIPRLTRRSLFALAAVAPALSGCSSVGAFNAVMPFDPESDRVAEGLAYGPDPRQKLDIYGPVARGGALPVAIFIYGGSWTSGDRGDYAFVGRALAAQGILAVVIDYRLVPQVRFPSFVEDAALATAWVKREVARFGGDPERLFVIGHSAGAYIASMISVTPAYTRTAGLQAPPFRGWVGLSGPYDFLPLDVDATIQAFGQTSDLSRTQPVAVATAGTPPALLVHGLADTTVKPRNTERLAAVLRARGVAVTTRFYEGVSHVGTIVDIARPFRSDSPVLSDTVAFIRSH